MTCPQGVAGCVAPPPHHHQTFKEWALTQRQPPDIDTTLHRVEAQEDGGVRCVCGQVVVAPTGLDGAAPLFEAHWRMLQGEP